MTAQDYSWCISAFSVAYTFSAFAWGSVLDRIGLRLGMTLSLFIWMVSSASHAAVGSFLGFAIARAALGLGEGSIFPEDFARRWIRCPPIGRRCIALAYSGSSLGSIAALIILTPAAIHYGWRMAFLVSPAVALLWLLVWVRRCEPSTFPNKSRTAQRLVLPNIRERQFWSLVSSYALGALRVGAIIYLTPLYLARAFGLAVAQSGFVLFWGWIADRYARASARPVWLVVLMAVLVPPVGAVHFISAAPIAIAVLTFGLFASGELVVVTLRTGALAYTHDQRRMAAGIASASFSAAVALTLPICGPFFDRHMCGAAVGLIALLPLVGVLIWVMLPARTLSLDQ